MKPLAYILNELVRPVKLPTSVGSEPEKPIPSMAKLLLRRLICPICVGSVPSIFPFHLKPRSVVVVSRPISVGKVPLRPWFPTRPTYVTWPEAHINPYQLLVHASPDIQRWLVYQLLAPLVDAYSAERAVNSGVADHGVVEVHSGELGAHGAHRYGLGWAS